MPDLRLELPVRARDQLVGSLSALVYDPTDGEVTHLVVRADDVPGADRLVPIEDLADVSDDEVTLRIARHELEALDKDGDLTHDELQRLAEQHGYIVAAPLGYRVDGGYGYNNGSRAAEEHRLPFAGQEDGESPRHRVAAGEPP